MRIVAEYDQLDDPGARGARLRREGLYNSHISQWRQARNKGAAGGLAEKPAGRQQVLDDAYTAHPERFTHRPLAPALPRRVWINQPRPTIQTQEDTQIIQVA